MFSATWESNLSATHRRLTCACASTNTEAHTDSCMLYGRGPGRMLPGLTTLAQDASLLFFALPLISFVAESEIVRAGWDQRAPVTTHAATNAWSGLRTARLEKRVRRASASARATRSEARALAHARVDATRGCQTPGGFLRARGRSQRAACDGKRPRRRGTSASASARAIQTKTRVSAHARADAATGDRRTPRVSLRVRGQRSASVRVRAPLGGARARWHGARRGADKGFALCSERTAGRLTFNI